MSLTSNMLRWIALASLLALKPALAEDLPPVRQILLLQSFDRGNLVLDYFTANLRVDLSQNVSGPVNFSQVSVNKVGSVGPSEKRIVDFIHSIFSSDRAPDLIVTAGGPAAVFARKYRQQLFPQTPLLFASVDRQFLADAPPAENEIAVPAAIDHLLSINEILHVLPETKEVFVILGSGEIGQFWRRTLDDQFKVFEGRVRFRWSVGLSLAEILRVSANLPPGSAIYFLNFGSDSTGGTYADERVIADLHATANAPLFGIHSVYFGRGFVGGSLISMDDIERSTVDAATKILNGASPSSLRIPAQLMSAPVFDWRELQRWNIDERRLPAGSVVKFRPQSLWVEHRTTVLSAAAILVVQALLIMSLLVQRRARRRAELESRRNLMLAADVSRRETMSALNHSIGHELFQPITSMMLNAEAAKTMFASGDATTTTIGEVLSDIHAAGIRAGQIIDRQRKMVRSRQLQPKSVDIRLIINESVALVAHELQTRGVSVRIELPATPCIVDGDQVLLQQVLVNLLMNAMDAMTEQPATQRRIAIIGKIRGTEVQVSVRDSGPGLSENILNSLFTAFVTTKPHGVGIGLTIVRSIIAAHKGTIEANNNVDGGATFTITLPRNEPQSSSSESQPIIDVIARMPADTR